MIVITKCPLALILIQQQATALVHDVHHFCGRQGLDGNIVISLLLPKGKLGDSWSIPDRGSFTTVNTASSPAFRVLRPIIMCYEVRKFRINQYFWTKVKRKQYNFNLFSGAFRQINVIRSAIVIFDLNLSIK